ncbi:MAG: hypothetical protein K6G04_04930 [Lachnospiraceae bacterium]|nr:hypothetical protein [Lachnospiraceae bacterium]
MNYVIAESIKTRRTIVSYFVVVAPIINLLLCMLIAGFYNLESFSLYWWSTFMAPALAALFCSEHERQNKKSGNDKMLYTYPIDLYRFRNAGIVALAIKLLAVYAVMAVVSVVAVMFLGYISFPLTTNVLAYLVLFLCGLWMLPACMLLSRFFNAYILLGVQVMLNLLLPPFLADTPLWVVCPYCYGPKAIEALAGVKISGDLIAPQGWNLTVILALVLSLIVFLALSIWESKLYERGFREKKVRK